jgi:hypothetical protein
MFTEQINSMQIVISKIAGITKVIRIFENMDMALPSIFCNVHRDFRWHPIQFENDLGIEQMSVQSFC